MNFYDENFLANELLNPDMPYIPVKKEISAARVMKRGAAISILSVLASIMLSNYAKDDAVGLNLALLLVLAGFANTIAFVAKADKMRGAQWHPIEELVDCIRNEIDFIKREIKYKREKLEEAQR